MTITDSMVAITCPCGYAADYNDFTRSPVTGDLPRNHYQCPKCRRAWTIRQTTPPRVGWSGMILPGTTIVEQVPSFL